MSPEERGAMRLVPEDEPEGKRMMKVRSSVVAVVAMSFVIMGLSACEKQEGPAERAGKEIDKSVQSAGQQLEKAGQQIQDAAKDAKK
jgi:predicted ABC-type transport system involved in lysophospholipase L1 biosynthesis ATPase subunit